jgi:hypothetical protein
MVLGREILKQKVGAARTMEDKIIELILVPAGFILAFVLTLPFRIFWRAFKHDFGLTEQAPETRMKAAQISRPPSGQGLWDRELDGPELSEPDN